MKSYNAKLLELDYINKYECTTPSGAKATYRFKRWKVLDPKSDIGKWALKINKESEKQEQRFIKSLNKLKWTFETNIITMEGDEYENKK